MKRHLDKISVPRNPIHQQRQATAARPQPRSPQPPMGRPNQQQRHPMNIQQANHQSEIFTLF